MYMSFIILEDDEPEIIWEAINNTQIVFHPKYSPNGSINYSEFQNLKREKEVIVFLDRNLFSSLMSLTKHGDLKSTKEKTMVALLMSWSQMNHLSISAGLAIMENASKYTESHDAKIELGNFNNIFDFYPTQMWLNLALGKIEHIPKCGFSNTPYENSVTYHESDDHFLMNFAAMLRLVRIYRDSEMGSVDKLLEFLNWYFDNLLISQYLNTYLVLLFSNQDGIKAPKYVNSSLFERIEKGCINQSWDLTYLSNWSIFYTKEHRMNDVFLFATEDIMLKHIFINTNNGGHLFNLINSIFSKRDAAKIIQFYTEKTTNRIKPDFGENPTQYFKALIEQEKNYLRQLIDL